MSTGRKATLGSLSAVAAAPGWLADRPAAQQESGDPVPAE
jgi:hypothetical protein